MRRVGCAAFALILAFLPSVSAEIAIVPNPDRTAILSPEHAFYLNFVIAIDCPTYLREANEHPFYNEPDYRVHVAVGTQEIWGGYVQTRGYYCESYPTATLETDFSEAIYAPWSLPAGPQTLTVDASLVGTDIWAFGPNPFGYGDVPVDVKPAVLVNAGTPRWTAPGVLSVGFGVAANLPVVVTLDPGLRKWVTCPLREAAEATTTSMTVDEVGPSGAATFVEHGELEAVFAMPSTEAGCTPVELIQSYLSVTDLEGKLRQGEALDAMSLVYPVKDLEPAPAQPPVNAMSADGWGVGAILVVLGLARVAAARRA